MRPSSRTRVLPATWIAVLLFTFLAYPVLASVPKVVAMEGFESTG